MKKVLTSIILSCLVFGSVFAAPKNIPAPTFDPISVDYISVKSESGITFTVDPRVEVVAIIGRLAECRTFLGYYTGEGNYTDSLKNFYGKHKDHKAVLAFKNLMAKGIDGEDLISLAFHMKDDFSGLIIDFAPFPSTLSPNWEKIKTKEIYKFVQLIHDFAADSNYVRISQLSRGDLLNAVGNTVKYFDDYKIALSKELLSTEPIHSNDFIVISPTIPVCYFANTAADSNGNVFYYTAAFPGCSALDFDRCYGVTHLSDFSKSIWDKVSEVYTKYYIREIKLEVGEEEAKKYIKDLKLDYHNASNFISSFLLLTFLKDPRYIEACAKDDYPVTYELEYAEMEKVYDGEYFERGIKLFDEYIENRSKYPTLESYSQQICDFLNSLPTE